jgi:two-component system, chemotaxis family, protein-glutamate methylesterase/glutaminase
VSKLIKVLVVDDSAFARKVVREVLAADGRIDVVGIARDGLDALEKIAALSPDVVTLDLVMPNLDGIGVLDALRERPDAPRVVVVTMSDADSALGVAALAGGAFDVVHKPTALATDRLYELGAELVTKVVIAGAASPGATRDTAAVAVTKMKAPATASKARIVVVGASTGGPRAVTLLLKALPTEMPIPVAVVVHMPAGYTEAFAARLDGDVGLHVVEASEGLALAPGTAAIGRAGMHFKISGGVAHLDVRPMDSLHRPSVDELFKSAAATYGAAVVAVVLTGMGSDGVEGARAVREAGGTVLVESAASCVVHGMPRAVLEAGLADGEHRLEEMAKAILERI